MLLPHILPIIHSSMLPSIHPSNLPAFQVLAGADSAAAAGRHQIPCKFAFGG